MPLKGHGFSHADEGRKKLLGQDKLWLRCGTAETGCGKTLKCSSLAD